MAYQVKWSATIMWIGDGAGAMSVPAQQSLTFGNQFGSNGGYVIVPGGDSPTGGNLTTAGTTCGTNIGTALNTALTQIQNWASGGG